MRSPPTFAGETPTHFVLYGYAQGELMAQILETACENGALTRAGPAGGLPEPRRRRHRRPGRPMDFSDPGQPPAREVHILKPDASVDGRPRSRCRACSPRPWPSSSGAAADPPAPAVGCAARSADGRHTRLPTLPILDDFPRKDPTVRGLMQDFPLTLPHLVRAGRALFADKEVVTATATGRDRTTYGDVGRTGPPARRRARRTRASATTAGSAPSPGTPPATSSCTSRPRAPAGCCTPSTSACSRSSSSTSSTTPTTR